MNDDDDSDVHFLVSMHFWLDSLHLITIVNVKNSRKYCPRSSKDYASFNGGISSFVRLFFPIQALLRILTSCWDTELKMTKKDRSSSSSSSSVEEKKSYVSAQSLLPFRSLSHIDDNQLCFVSGCTSFFNFFLHRRLNVLKGPIKCLFFAWLIILVVFVAAVVFILFMCVN